MRDTLQDLIDGLSAQWKLQRAESQMTLGDLIILLMKLDPAMEVDGITEPHSYRGYYTDLAFEKTGQRMTVAEALKVATSACNQTFEGYKGGDFYMNTGTPIWFASYGCCGVKILGLNPDGTWETAEDQF